MARTKHKTAESARILGRLRDVASQGKEEAVKFTWVKKVLMAVVRDAPKGMKLPSIRDLSEACGVAVVPTQRAVQELVNEGILNSVPRSGVFVADTESATVEVEEQKSVSTVTQEQPFSAFSRCLQFGTDSNWDFQVQFWHDLFNGFQKRCPNIDFGIRTIVNPGENCGCDVFERSLWLDWCPGEVDDALEIGEMLREELPEATIYDRGIPLYYRTLYMFLNRKLLAEYGIEEPAYRTFAEQSEFVRQVCEVTGQHKHLEQPFSICQPIMVLGTSTWAILNAISDGDDVPKKVLDEWVDTVEMIRMVRSTRSSDAKKTFAEGKNIIYYGYDVDYWWMTHHDPDFDWAVYPGLCTDDSLSMWPRIGMVSKQTKYPLEAVRFLSYLYKNGQQFATTGSLPACTNQPEIEKLTSDKEWFSELIKRSTPFSFNNRRDAYLINSVLNDELWQLSCDNELDPQKSLERAMRQGRMYLKANS